MPMPSMLLAALGSGVVLTAIGLGFVPMQYGQPLHVVAACYGLAIGVGAGLVIVGVAVRFS